MPDRPSLTHRGNFTSYPFAELMVEIHQTGLSGSLRASFENRKAIFYFRGGRVVYAVTNSKSLKLFNLLLKRKKSTARLLPSFLNLPMMLRLPPGWFLKIVCQKRKLIRFSLSR